MDYSSEFDIDLEFGEIAENEIKEILYGKIKIEVKTDRMAHKTGNLFFEFESRGKKSGIAITKAKWFAISLFNSSAMVWYDLETLKVALKRLLGQNKAKVINGGDNNTSKGILVKYSILLEEFRRLT